ncbi:hypothetical protein U27_01978 [Candidatus Vecturithrix granuli]|uniref:Uncharacterized protein n=1 Tax=Vecturithrix granuli TaxID=1499967 RepID=A0A0S6W9L6_VECG1|nr:hypothetical protein U27_01978 [Candidatus Vecturithrix granuli]
MSIFFTRPYWKITIFLLFFTGKIGFLFSSVRAAVEPNGQEGVCGPYYIWYQVSPADYDYAVDYVDLCGIIMNISDIVDDFDFVYFENTDGYQWRSLDKNHDGISDLFFIRREQDHLKWQPESGCIRIYMRNCRGKTLNEQCGHAAIRIQPKYGVREGSAKLSIHTIAKCPPTGFDCSKSFTLIHKYSNCLISTPLPDFLVQKQVNDVLFISTISSRMPRFEYTLLVQNTSSEIKDTELTDSMSDGTKGGALILSEVKIDRCPSSATCFLTGIDDNRMHFSFKNFPPGEQAKIIYIFKGNSDDIARDEVSYFTNIATLSKGNSAQVTVGIKGLLFQTPRPERPRHGSEPTHPRDR